MRDGLGDSSIDLGWDAWPCAAGEHARAWAHDDRESRSGRS